ncbi:MAG: hypothetical protein LBC68_02075 [Prevotellaceae bacterium]|jgi:hypothetical protein|nr:hypothetical protein [Prevotellaceae bacterium]
MKTKYIIIILTVFFGGSCVKQEQSFTPSPFRPALELAITELIDSLKNELGENKLLSIEFYFPDSHTNYRNRRGGEMSMYILDGYASANIDGYTKINSTTIAIYNLKDDVFELVNKNDITFFTDTIVGFKDICVLDLTGKEQFFYKIITEDSITKVSYSMDFSYSIPLREPRCHGGISWSPPEEFLFHDDSLRAEENLKYYQKEVEYYRNKRPK